MNIAFRGSRFQREKSQQGDYINCPLSEAEYGSFVNHLVGAERIEIKEFEKGITNGVRAGSHEFFEGCLPVEELAKRGRQTLAFGPMRPVGLVNPHTGQRPYAVVQLRQDNLVGSLYNMVGFQTNLTYPEQKRIFHMIPGLAYAEFVRLGQMHRNTYIASPKLLYETLQYRNQASIFFAGQITGVEGYMGNIATGLIAGINAARYLNREELVVLPGTTMLGALIKYITHAEMADFQPMKANMGLLPELGTRSIGKRERAIAYSHRSLDDLKLFVQNNGIE
jgi:methylenetetrahydrofolate--tRNA-(uracil-5-)-methyltransferase